VEVNQLLGPNGYIKIETRELSKNEESSVHTVFVGPYKNVAIEHPKRVITLNKNSKESEKVENIIKELRLK
jgi:hypothetical protein